MIVTAYTAEDHPTCESCGTRAATLVLTYADTRFRLCQGCIDPAAFVEASQ